MTSSLAALTLACSMAVCGVQTDTASTSTTTTSTSTTPTTTATATEAATATATATDSVTTSGSTTTAGTAPRRHRQLGGSRRRGDPGDRPRRDRGHLDDTFIAWSGATVYDMTQGSGIYFQISGPEVFIELSDQQGSAGADVTGVVTAGWGHIHTIYRNPTNDYANSVTQQESAGPGGGAGPAGTPPNG